MLQFVSFLVAASLLLGGLAGHDRSKPTKVKPGRDSGVVVRPLDGNWPPPPPPPPPPPGGGG